MKKNTLDKFMLTRLDIKNSKAKIVTLPDGTQVSIPKLSYRHFVKIKALANPMDLVKHIIDEIQPRPLTAAEAEFILIHLHYHNDKQAAEVIKEIGINLDDMKISDPVYQYTFDNIEVEFSPPSMMDDNLGSLIKRATVDGSELELTEDNRLEIINSLYRHEFITVKRGVLQEVYIVHEGKTIKGLNIIGD